MINILWGNVGTVLFWMLWPVWVVYFRYFKNRSRILVVVDTEILVVSGWLGDKRLGLPGGGTKRHETARNSAVRELFEETGILVAESSLTELGRMLHKSRGLRYTAEYFVLQLPKKPVLKLRKPEIFSACWIAIDYYPKCKLGDDTVYAVSKYRPPTQASLL